MSYSNRNVLNSWNFKLQEFLFRTDILDESKFEYVEIMMLHSGCGSVYIRCGKRELICGSNIPIEMLKVQQFVMRTILNEARSNENSKVHLTRNGDVRRFNLIEYDEENNETCNDCYVEMRGSDNAVELRISANLMEVFRH